MKENDFYIERLRELMSEYKLNVNSLSKEINIPQATLNKQTNGSNNVSLNVLSAILDRYPEISAEWLMRGTGNMMIEEREIHNQSFDIASKKLSDAILVLSQMVNEKVAENERLQEELKRYKQ